LRLHARVVKAFWALFLIGGLSACLRDVELDAQPYPCRSAADCVAGFVCDPTRFVCVLEGTRTPTVADGGAPADAAREPDDAGPAADAATPDATAPDAAAKPGLGEPCADGGCREGRCVDGVCCASACAGPCERCDLRPGECTPVPRGRDPDDECPDLDCATLTYGLVGGVCYAYRAETRAATCDGARSCTTPSCVDAAQGVGLARCADEGCVAPNVCPAGQPIGRFDSAAELCGGPAQACRAQTVGEGCCSPVGRCCPAGTCEAAPSDRCPE
jgi:hypothetical protein